MKLPYSQQYQPPAPVLKISLAVPDEAAELATHLALIDTGADGTFVPTSLLETLAVPVVYTTYVRTHVGVGSHQVSVYEIDILFNNIRLPSIDVVADDWGDEIILGRNVLNKLQFLLNGPKQVTEIK